MFPSIPSPRALLAVLMFAAPAEAGASPRSAAPAPCDLRHPIEVHVTALDPVAHGRTVRLRVEVRSHRALDRAAVRVASTGGATAASRVVERLGSVRPERARAAEFAFTVPATGHRFLVQFQVEGESGDAHWMRGATYNLLPEGPADVGRAVVGPGGEGRLEFAARRIDR